MKLKQYIKLVCLASFTVTAASCLDLEPKADLGDNLVWNKADNFQLFANQFYGWLPDFARPSQILLIATIVRTWYANRKEMCIVTERTRFLPVTEIIRATINISIILTCC